MSLPSKAEKQSYVARSVHFLDDGSSVLVSYLESGYVHVLSFNRLRPLPYSQHTVSVTRSILGIWNGKRRLMDVCTCSPWLSEGFNVDICIVVTHAWMATTSWYPICVMVSISTPYLHSIARKVTTMQFWWTCHFSCQLLMKLDWSLLEVMTDSLESSTTKQVHFATSWIMEAVKKMKILVGLWRSEQVQYCHWQCAQGS